MGVGVWVCGWVLCLLSLTIRRRSTKMKISMMCLQVSEQSLMLLVCMTPPLPPSEELRNHPPPLDILPPVVQGGRGSRGRGRRRRETSMMWWMKRCSSKPSLEPRPLQRRVLRYTTRLLLMKWVSLRNLLLLLSLSPHTLSRSVSQSLPLP